MPQVTVYRCPFTDKLFPLQEKEKYIKHLKALRKRHASARALRRINRGWAALLADGKRTVSSLEDLGRWIIDNSPFIGKYSKAMHTSPPDNNFRIIEVRFINPTYSSCCSNTHSSPLGKKTNWGRLDVDAPRGYPGIACSLEFKTAGKKNAYMGDIFSSMQVHLGTGSGRGEGNYRYSSIIWLEDWPRIEESISLAILKNELNKGTDIIITENP